MKRRSLFLALLFVLLLGTPTSAHHFEDPIHLWMDGRYLYSDVVPYIRDSRTMVPLRVLSENFGYEVDWNGDARKVTIRKDASSPAVSLVIGETSLYGSEAIAGRPVTMDTAAEIREDRTFVPLRAVAELFGHAVDWDNNTRTVVIGSGYRSPYVDDFSERTMSLSFGGSSRGDVRAFAEDGMVLVEYTGLARALDLRNEIERGIFSKDFPEHLAVTLIEKNGRSVTFLPHYIYSSDGLNFYGGKDGWLSYKLVDDRVFIPLRAYADANHLKLRVDGNSLDLATDPTKDIYPIQVVDYTDDTYPVYEHPSFFIYWNGDRYVLIAPDSEEDIGDEMDFEEYRAYTNTPDFEELFYEDPEYLYRLFKFFDNNHFILVPEEHLVSGFMGD